MARADDLRVALDAELAVVELEEELARLKTLEQPDPEQLQERRRVKLDLRSARQRHRQLRAGPGAGAGGVAGPGDATASPDTIQTTASAAVGEEG